MFISDFNNDLMREPDILPGIGRDIYISPIEYNENSSSASLQASSAKPRQVRGRNIVLKKGESFEFNNAKITFKKFLMPGNAMENMTGWEKFSNGCRIKYKLQRKKLFHRTGNSIFK